VVEIIIFCVCVYVYMASKTVNLSEEAYERLKEWKKGDNESFSQMIVRVLPKRRDVSKILEEYEASELGLSEEAAKQLEKDIE